MILKIFDTGLNQPNTQGRFLVLSDSTVLVGVCLFHSMLWDVYKKEIDTKSQIPDLIGAGLYNISTDKILEIVKWKSAGYQFDTPEENKRLIQEFLNSVVDKLPTPQ